MCGVQTNSGFILGETKIPKFAPGGGAFFQAQFGNKFSGCLSFDYLQYAGSKYENQLEFDAFSNAFLKKENFTFTSKSLQMDFTLGWNLLSGIQKKHTQLYLLAGIGIADFHSKALFLDGRDSLYDWMSNQRISNPAHGSTVEETYEGIHMIIPVGLQYNLQMNQRAVIGIQAKYFYEHTDDIDVLNSAIWTNKWFDSLLQFNFRFAYLL